MWKQQGRRVRNRQSYDVVGLLPAEEAAIRRALRESLRTAAAEKSRDDSSSSSSSSSTNSSRSPSPKEQHVGSKRRGEESRSHPPVKRIKLNKQNNSNSTLVSFNGLAGHLSCQSPAKLSVPPSPMSERSSPVISESDSLKLMLSTSSDSSSSSSPCQDFSSKRKPTKKTSKKAPKAKRILLAEFSTSVGQKTKPLKGSKSTSKQKKKNETISDGSARIKSGKKNQCAPHQDSACSSKVKTAKAKQTTPGKKGRKKVSMTLADNLSIGSGLSSTLTSVNLPDIHDSGAARTVTMGVGSPSRAEDDGSREECGQKLEQQKTATFTCMYSAQRKFASNHTPPARFPERELIENPMNLKEVPKTQDFITFLCLRGSSSVPEALRKFSQPWTPTLFKRSKTVRVRSDNGKISKSRQCGSAVKKLVYPNSSTVSGSKAINQVVQV